MYIGLLNLHGIVRWLIITVAVAVLLKYLMGLLSQAKWGKTDNILGIVYTLILDIQLLTGLLLYFLLSPLTQMAFRDFGAAMKNQEMRFFTLEHPLMMLIAIILVHIGKSRIKKSTTNKAKFVKGLLFYGISFAIMLGVMLMSPR